MATGSKDVLRFNFTINKDSHPDIYEHLSSLPTSYAKAEEMRTLMRMGLVLYKGGGAISLQSSPALQNDKGAPVAEKEKASSPPQNINEQNEIDDMIGDALSDFDFDFDGA